MLVVLPIYFDAYVTSNNAVKSIDRLSRNPLKGLPFVRKVELLHSKMKSEMTALLGALSDSDGFRTIENFESLAFSFACPP
jgi:hypothetical protein